MRKLLLLFALTPLLMAHTCEDDDYHRHHHPCTTEARAGINVTVTLNGEAITTPSGIVVTARDGNYIEDLQPIIPDTPTFSGAWERPGLYIVTVSKTGYQTYTSEPLPVHRDECHVIPEHLTINLVPNP
ncbi:carboxypeptidase-like regulatory domain-containing protein [Flavobacterium caeni]|uniref:Carboxypeptidase regulatory-like domain-containing protein n=1 Tax=Flavobacterium caeni TaxID=490189 RepID=A0A1G5GY80_9FLAO|nr:carboxypeptidase-like regulatory domain-containing protein [Flavobacterium caeni]SCY55608.1 hypothetical protein SAMN02927903_01647 [Flavobacterium caeni]